MKKTFKISLSTFFLIIAVVIIIVMACYIYIEKSNSSSKIADLEANATNMQSTIDNLQGKIDTISNTISNNSKNISSTDTNEISYILVKVEDSSAKELSYKSKKITNRSEIKSLLNVINNATEYETKNFIPDFGDIPPCVEFYNSNGEKYTIVAGDKITDNGSVINLMTKWHSEDGNDKKTFKVNVELGKYIENLYNNY